MLPKSVLTTAKLFNIFYYKTWLIPYEFRIYKKGYPLKCVLAKSKWRKLKFIQGFVNTFLGVLSAIYFGNQMASSSTDNPKVFGYLVFTILAGVAASLACVSMVSLLRDLEDITQVIEFGVQVDTVLEGLFKEERKRIRPSIWYTLIGYGMSVVIIAIALMATLFGVIVLIENPGEKDTPTLGRMLVQVVGYPAAKGDHILVRLIASLLVFTPAIHLVAVITFYVLSSITGCLVWKFWIQFLVKLDRWNAKERMACRLLTISIQECNRHSVILLPALVFAGQVLIVFSLFGSIKFYHVAPMPNYLILPTFFFVVQFAVVTCIPQAAEINSASKLLKENWGNHPDPYIRRFARSCRPIRCEIGPFFIVQTSTLVTFMQIALDQTINLLLSY